MLDQSFYQKADEIIAFYGKKPASLIPIMQISRGCTDISRKNCLHMLRSRSV